MGWDVISFVYIMEMDNGFILCILMVFVFWIGEVLDKKVFLLWFIVVMDKVVCKVFSLLGNEDIVYVNFSCGVEQEYFLVDVNFVS